MSSSEYNTIRNETIPTPSLARQRFGNTQTTLFSKITDFIAYIL